MSPVTCLSCDHLLTAFWQNSRAAFWPQLHAVIVYTKHYTCTLQGALDDITIIITYVTFCGILKLCSELISVMHSSYTELHATGSLCTYCGAPLWPYSYQHNTCPKCDVFQLHIMLPQMSFCLQVQMYLLFDLLLLLF